MAPPILLLASTAQRTQRHADCIAQIDNDLRATANQHGLAVRALATVTPDEILQFIRSQGNDIALFHFSGRYTDFQKLLDAASAANMPSLPQYLAALPQLRFVFLSYCSRPKFVIRLRDAGIETIVGTSHRLTQNENDEFALTFYRYFTTTDRSVRYAFAEAISAAQISTSNQKRYFAGLHGRGNLRRWWINVGNRRNTGQLSPNIIGNNAFFEERLGRLKNDWPSVVNSGQAAAMLAYHSTVLAPPRGRTETEIQAEFARWGNSSLKLAERLSKLSLLNSSGSTGALIYQGDATLDTAIFKELYTANNNLARFRQFVANLVSLPQRIQRTAYTAYQKAIALPARIWKWGQRYAQRFAWGAVVVGATIILGLALQALMLKNQLQMDLARHVGELSSPTQFILSRKAETKPIMDRVMEWFTGYDPLRPSEVNFQLIGPLPSPAALEEGTAHTHWQRILLGADQTFLAAVSDDGTIGIWSPQLSQAPTWLQTGANAVVDLAFDAAQQQLAYTDPQGMVRLRNLNTAQERNIANHGPGHTFVRFSDNGLAIVSGGADGRICTYVVAEKNTESIVTASLQGVTALAVDPIGRYIAYATATDHQIYVWDRTAQRYLATLTGHRAEITALEFRPAEHLLLSTSRDYTVRLWPLDDFSQSTILVTQGEQLPQAHFLANSPLVVTTGDVGTIQLWRTDDPILLETQPVSDREIASLTASRDGKALAVTDGAGNISLWSVGALLAPLAR